MNSYLAIAVMSLVTIVLRFIPFIFLNDKKEYKTLNYLSKVLPCAIMGMLVVFCLKDTNITNIIPTILATIVVIISYIIKRNTLISIIAGTLVYMLLL